MANSSAEPLYLVAVISPRMESAADVERHLRALMAGTRMEDGCEYKELVVSDTDADIWILLEKFRSRTDCDVHTTTRHFIDCVAALTDLLREPTELRIYTEK